MLCFACFFFPKASAHPQLRPRAQRARPHPARLADGGVPKADPAGAVPYPSGTFRERDNKTANTAIASGHRGPAEEGISLSRLTQGLNSA